MQLRPLILADLDELDEIDATIDSSQYAHVERKQPAEGGFALTFSVEERPLRERRTRSNRLTDETRFLARQIASGADEGLAVVAEHEGQVVGLLLARPEGASRVFDLVELRVDFDHRREGLGLAMTFQLINAARELEFRAVRAETTADNFPAISLLRKCSFELAGLDTHRHSNHDLVKEAVTLLFYAALD